MTPIFGMLLIIVQVSRVANKVVKSDMQKAREKKRKTKSRIDYHEEKVQLYRGREKWEGKGYS